MTQLLQLLIDGLGRGAVYALLALGVVVVFKATRVVNFAHGSLVLLGGFAVVVLSDVVGWWPAAAIGVAAAALAGLLVERLLLATARHPDQDTMALLTIGIDVIVIAELVRRLGARVAFGGIPFVGNPYDTQPIRFAGFVVFRTDIAAVVVTATLATMVVLALRYTRWGVAMRALGENREGAALVGIRAGRVTATAWMVAGALAGVAVLFVATQDFAGSGLASGTPTIALIALPAAVIGGLDSVAGSIVGGLVVGLTEVLAVRYLSVGFATTAVFLLMTLLLVLRPVGLFGTRELTRV